MWKVQVLAAAIGYLGSIGSMKVRDMLWVVTTGHAVSAVPDIGPIVCHLFRSIELVSVDDQYSDLPPKAAKLREQAAEDWSASRTTYLPANLLESTPNLCAKPSFKTNAFKSQVEAEIFLSLRRSEWRSSGSENAYTIEF